MTIPYAYSWNAPRQAIASPYLTHAQIYRRDQLIAAVDLSMGEIGAGNRLARSVPRVGVRDSHL